jgi:hypothetical protein
LRTLTPGATGLSASTLTAPLLANGAARATYAGTLTASGGFCGTAIVVLCSQTAAVTIPITVFADHPLANPTAPGPGSPPSPLPSAWYWFIANNWHHVTYYAVSPDDAPGGARNCPGNGNCLNVNFDAGTSLTNRRAILALAGRSLNGTSGSSRTFSDFLDTADNINFNNTFEQKRIGRGMSGTLNARGEFNDRFISLAP